MSNHTLGERIKFHRKRIGLTQEQLAQRMGVSAQAVSKWENNLSCPDISVLPELANLFGITLDELLGKQESVRAEVVEDEHKGSSNWSWQWNAFPAKKSGVHLFSFYLISIGAVMLMNNLFSFDVSWWTVVWTLALAFTGLGGLFKRFSIFSLIVCLTGVGFLVSEYVTLPIKFSWGLVIPALILLWGLSLLIDTFGIRKSIRRAHRNTCSTKEETREYSCADGYLSCDYCFGSQRTAVVADTLRGGMIDCSFGEFTFDFSACKTAAPDCLLSVDNSFGSVTLLFPTHLAAKMKDHDNSFASVSFNGSPAAVTNGTVLLNLDNSFGTIHIRYIEV